MRLADHNAEAEADEGARSDSFACTTMCCMKSEVYSWRVSAELKTDLEQEARRRKVSVSAPLDLATRELLKKGDTALNGVEEQMLLQRAAMQCVGAFEGGKVNRSETARLTLKKRLRSLHEG